MKHRFTVIITLLIFCLYFTSLTSASAAQSDSDSQSVETVINRDLVQRYINEVETSNNDITYYMLSIFNTSLNAEQTAEVTKAIQEKIRDLEADISELSRNIRIDDYSCQTCQLLTTLSISLQHNKNALNELLAYLNSEENSERLDNLERFFFSKTSSYQNLDWVKRILANSVES